jgi:hypothetical protein
VGKKLKKTLVKFDLGHKFAKQAGLPDPSGDAIYGSERALTPAEQQAKDTLKQQQALANQQAIIAQNATALQANSATDNTVTAIAGGTADSVDSPMDFKRRRSSSVASTLGV